MDSKTNNDSSHRYQQRFCCRVQLYKYSIEPQTGLVHALRRAPCAANKWAFEYGSEINRYFTDQILPNVGMWSEW